MCTGATTKETSVRDCYCGRPAYQAQTLYYWIVLEVSSLYLSRGWSASGRPDPVDDQRVTAVCRMRESHPCSLTYMPFPYPIAQDPGTGMWSYFQPALRWTAELGPEK
jgi:hypothetical protein